MVSPFTFAVGQSIELSEFPTRVKQNKIGKTEARERLSTNAIEMADLARRMFAENTRSILLVLQGMDTAGKDGTIRAVMRGMNPRSCQVVSFKKPSVEELEHDFLWRVHHTVPRKGNIGIFNRSHYEDVLVVRVHNLVPPEVWSKRYEHINDFEKLLTDSGTAILKCFLHVSKDEQRSRLQERIDRPEKNWKFNPDDLVERKLWDQYQDAYLAALMKCNTAYAPWYIVPSDQKWYRNLVVSNLVLQTLRKLDPQYPQVQNDISGIVVE